MNITMQLMADYLSDCGTLSRYGYFKKNPLLRPCLWNRRISPVSGGIYVAETSELPDEPEFPADCLLVCTGSPPEQTYLSGRIPLIYLPDMDLPQLLNQVLDIYCGLVDWSNELQRIVFQDGSIDRLVRCSLPVIGNFISVTDTKMNSIARCCPKSDNVPESSPTAEHLYDGPLNPEDASAVRKRIQTFGYDVAPRLCRDYGGHVYNIDLLLGNLHLGQLSIMDTNRPFRPGDSQLLEELAHWITKAFQKRSAFLSSRPDSFRMLMFELLEDYALSDEEISQRSFYSAQSAEASSYFCIAVCLPEGSEQFSPSYIANLLEKEFPGLCAREYQGNAVALICCPEEKASADSLFAHLEELLEKLGLRCGVSRSFRHLQFLRNHYYQAAAAQETGVQMYPSRRLFFFQDTVLPYMILHAAGSLTVEQVCPGGLLELRKRNHGEYWNSLKAYLHNGCNASETARSLYLHRSTLLKHLSRAEQILGIKLEGADEMLYLQMCMRLIELKSK